jgi:enamine deaminase RidA (YjgF/YER057c/UK114 family)
MTSRDTTMTSGRVEFLAPDGLVKRPAFSHVAVVSGAVRTIYVGGQDAVRSDGEIVGKGDLAAQTTQILANIETALAAAGAGLEHVIKWNVFVLEGNPVAPAYEAFQRAWGDRSTPPPLITAAFVKGLGHPDWLAEVDAIAVVPA